MATQLDEAEKQILGALLVDFTGRKLNTQSLKKRYEGPKVADLSGGICTGDEITEVDFDLALKDLEKKKLIRTGPYRAYDNEPGSSFIIIAGYSLREYASLTELGYKAAKQAPNRPSKPHRIINNVHISGGNFTNMQLAAGGTVSQKLQANSGTDSETLIKLISILENQGQSVTEDQQRDLLNAIEHAKDGNGKEARSLLEKVCGPAWEAVQPVMWPIIGEVLRQSLGI